MQDKYAGDIGDYVKLALLRALLPDRRLSVAWFKTADDRENNDGALTGYLADNQALKWRHLDPSLYDELKNLVDGQARSIDGLQRILAGPPIFLRDHSPPFPSPPATFHDSPLTRRNCRSVWFVGLTLFVARSDLLFLDPDNGVTSRPQPSPKHVSVEEVHYLLDLASTMIVYHHLGRRGSHSEQVISVGKSLTPPFSYKAVCAVRVHTGSSRAFFIVAPDRQIWDRAEAFAERWRPHVSFQPITEPPEVANLTSGASAYHRAEATYSTFQDQLDRGDFAVAFRKPPEADG